MHKKQVEDLEKMLKLFIDELEKNIKVEKVILFGSYARNAQRDYSDIDILVVSDDLEGGTEKDYILLDDAARKINSLIEAIPCTLNDFENFEKGDFVHEIRKNGRIIYDNAA
ncbi:nucleotidyltransferase domain-containing protein [bacterium]|nr:nucleotidyltransferase domain-containing protein [bacterium]